MPEQGRFEYRYSEDLPSILHRLGITLAVSTYQAGKVVLLRANGDRLSALLRTFDRVMGMSVSRDELVLGTRNQLIYFRNAPEIARQMGSGFDACFVPRRAYFTGDVLCHEVARSSSNQITVVNTRFSCLCQPNDDYSFLPFWRPKFISSLAAEDRCHLNGVAVDAKGVRYATAFSRSDTPQGWRENKSNGIVIDVPADEIIAGNLFMPHSPRLHNGRLYVLNSGRGELLVIERDLRKQVIQRLSGYVRGMAFAGPYAFVGLSKFRDHALSESGPDEDRICGVVLVDLSSGACVGNVEFRSDIEEIFDVQTIPYAFPNLIGLRKPDLDGMFLLP